MTFLYSILHLLVDGMCALAMFGRYIPRKEGYLYILLYNFCAFVLQMPFGAALDILGGKKAGRGRTDPAFLTAAAGVLCTIAGTGTHPVVLGVGNALFHVGGGVGTIGEDHARGSRGARLGIFVAPGALGLYLGSLAAKESEAAGGTVGNPAGSVPGKFFEVFRLWARELDFWLAGTAIVMLLLLGAGLLFLHRQGRKGSPFVGPPVRYGVPGEERSGCGEDVPAPGVPFAGGCDSDKGAETDACAAKTLPWGNRRMLRLAFCCLLVVVLRSYIGMSVAFPWKTGAVAGLFSVLAVVGGKVAGGLAAARHGSFRTAVVSLILASFCYLFSASMSMGLAALFLFNMTMPVTLYWMVRGWRGMPGFAFGFLTFALFLGFLPVYFALPSLWGGCVAGSLGSILSLLLMAAGAGGGGQGGKRSD